MVCMVEKLGTIQRRCFGKIQELALGDFAIKNSASFMSHLSDS